EQNKVMVSTILNLAKTFDLNIVAEGVETLEQMNFLAQKHCDVLQGFYFSKPISDTEFERFYYENIAL
ncbi:MAG: EAL domain-containing protein, partial [Pseudomonadota bacterium]